MFSLLSILYLFQASLFAWAFARSVGDVIRLRDVPWDLLKCLALCALNALFTRALLIVFFRPG